jgi:RND family efflux transporter MFP subunit
MNLLRSIPRLSFRREKGGTTCLLLAVPFVLLIAGCGKPPENGAAPKTSASAGDARIVEASAITVSVAPVTQGDIRKTIEVTGSLVALQDVTVGTKMPGRVAAVYLHEGDPVSAGQVVAVMDTTDLNAQVTSAQAALQSALTREEQAQAQLLQARNTLQTAKVTLQWTDKTSATAVQVAKTGLKTAEERLSIVKQGARSQERAQAEESVRAAKASYDKARADLKRYQELYREQAVSQSQLDQAQAAFDAAQAQYNSALQALSLIKEGARPEEIRTAELAVDQAEDTLARADADRAQVELRRQDMKNAEVGVRVAESAVKTAQAGVSQARAALRIAQDQLSNAYIKSPIRGYVAQRMAEPGQQLGGGGAVMRITAPDTVYFQATLSESLFEEVRLGQPVTVRVDALPGRTLGGRVSRILPVASSAARSFTIRVDIPTDSRMRPQMFARGSILIGTHRNAVLVPKDAVLFDPITDRARIFVTGKNNAAEERPVDVGYMNPQSVEILSGVRPGEKVIVAGQNALQNGDRIKVQ